MSKLNEQKVLIWRVTAKSWGYVDARVNQGVYKNSKHRVIGNKQHEIITVRGNSSGLASANVVIDGVQSVFGPGFIGVVWTVHGQDEMTLKDAKGCDK